MPTRRARFRRRVYRRLPRWLREHDFEVFVAFLGLLAGVPLLAGEITAQSVYALLPSIIVRVWGLVLVLGCFSVLLGVFQGSRKAYPERVLWMRVEALGLTALAYYCYLYTVCIIGFNFASGWSASMIILAFGVTCHIREAAVMTEIDEYRRTLGLEERG